MPNAVSGLATFPGLSPFVTCSYSCAHGPSPGVVQLVVPMPLNNDVPLAVDKTKDLVLTDGDKSFTLKDCRCASVQETAVQGGKGWSVTLYDRRWKWKFPTVAGLYNQRDQAGKINPILRAKVHTLAEICLKAMGEVDGSWDISDLPNPDEDEMLPAVTWDYTNAAEALAQLCDRFGRRLIFQPIANRVLIAKAGTGEDLPDGSYSETSASKEAKAKPEMVRLVGAPALFVAPIILEAVGEDLDGSIVKIDELSYTPKDGWSLGFSGLQLTPKFAAKGKKLTDCKAAAEKTVYKWYRVTTAGADKSEEIKINGLDLLGGPNRKIAGPDGIEWQVVSPDQIVPLDRIIGTERDENRELYTDPAIVHGSWWFKEANTPADQRITVPFSIDSERGLVMFDQRMWRSNLGTTPTKALIGGGAAALVAGSVSPKGTKPAELVLLCSFHIRGPQDHAMLRYTRERVIANGHKGLIQYMMRDDVQFAAFVDYNTLTWNAIKKTDNWVECNKAADFYLDEALDFDDKVAETRTYPRLVLIDPDGAIQSVTWNCSGSVSTQVSRNNERVPYLATYLNRRGLERGKVLSDGLDSIIAGQGIFALGARAYKSWMQWDSPPPG